VQHDRFAVAFAECADGVLHGAPQTLLSLPSAISWKLRMVLRLRAAPLRPECACAEMRRRVVKPSRDVSSANEQRCLCRKRRENLLRNVARRFGVACAPQRRGENQLLIVRHQFGERFLATIQHPLFE
jgi:hypothetical protein